MKRSFIREILESIDSETISFAGGLPDESLFPIEDLKRASQKVFENPKNLQYTISNGITPLREKMDLRRKLQTFSSQQEANRGSTSSQNIFKIRKS
jgi:2-aminoadipate transaminase